jgi:anthranilate synthase component 1
LRTVNPAPYMFYLRLGGTTLIGSSPEVMVRLEGREVTVRPIAGTRPRGTDERQDLELEQELCADPKEIAEHIMLVDLGRNDVGRVAMLRQEGSNEPPGAFKGPSVRVTDSFYIERYSHVMHIVSNVIGTLDEKNHDAIDALMGGFPAGTVSGAPKVRAMEIIAELEKAKRGPYAGCVGYFSAGGEMDTCIVLRTAILKDGMVHVQAGAGIVHDSIPENEQQECINKAKALVRAAEEALRFASKGSATPGNGGTFG